MSKRPLTYREWLRAMARIIETEGPEAAADAAGVPVAFARRYRAEHRSAARRSARWDRETVRA